VREAENLITVMYRMSWKSGSLNLLEPSGPHRACYGNPLPFFYLNIWQFFCGLGIVPYQIFRLSECISVLGIIFQHPRIKLKAVSLFHSHYLKEYRLGTGTSFVLYSEIQAEAFRKFCTEPKFSIHI